MQKPWEIRGIGFMETILFLLFKIFFFFDVDHFLKPFLNFLQYCLGFGIFGHKAYWILTPWPGIKPTTSALEDEVLTIGLPRKSCNCFKHEGKGVQ